MQDSAGVDGGFGKAPLDPYSVSGKYWRRLYIFYYMFLVIYCSVVCTKFEASSCVTCVGSRCDICHSNGAGVVLVFFNLRYVEF